MSTLYHMMSMFDWSIEKAEKHCRGLIYNGDMSRWLDLALLYTAMGKFDEAEEYNKKYGEYFPDCPRLGYSLGWRKLSKGDFQGGLAGLERGRENRNWGSAYVFPGNVPQWNGEDGNGRTMLFGCEAGLGDEIIGVRCVRHIIERGFKVVVACHPDLVELFSTAGASAVADKEAALRCYHDLWVPAMSAPRLLGWTYETLPGTPYLSVPKNNLAWDIIIPKGRVNIGLRWAGNPKYEMEQFRKFPPELLLRVAQIPGVRCYSLQRDEDLVDLPDNVTDLSGILDTWGDTANAVARMDLVITSCTSVAHLAGALGAPTWVISPVMPYYVWALPGDTSPWYNSVRLFRQTRFGHWDDVLGRVYEEAEKYVRSKV